MSRLNAYINYLDKRLSRFFMHHPLCSFILVFTGLPAGLIFLVGFLCFCFVYPIQLLLGGI